MLDGVAHWRPLINGDSGFMPRPYTREMELLTTPADEEALRLLRAVDVRHVVAREALALPLAATAGEDRVYEVPPGEAARAPSGGDAVPTVWGDDGVVADLGTVRVVESVLFELSDATWVAAPAVAISSDGVRWQTVAGRASLADATLALLQDPKHALGEVVLPSVSARWIRLPPEVPARPGLLRVRAR
jgi:hypothetical protein